MPGAHPDKPLLPALNTTRTIPVLRTVTAVRKSVFYSD